MVAHNPFIKYYENQASGKQQQIGHGFYTGLPWQKGYGIGSVLGSIARRFALLLNPLSKAVGKRLLHTGTSFVSDVIDGKPVGVAARIGLKKFVEKRNKKCRHDDSGIIPEIRNIKRRRHDSGIIPKIRNKKRCRNNLGIIPKKRRRRKQDIFS